MNKPIILRPLEDSDINAYTNLLHSSFNTWYHKHGWGKDYFQCSPAKTSIFYDIYNDLTPGCSIAAFDTTTQKMMGACFYHPREHHVSLGIMSVHPKYGGQGVGSMLVDYIIDYTSKNGYKSCRLVSSAINIDSFSLYNRAGFIPRVTYQDMVLEVPDKGFTHGDVSQISEVRNAEVKDVKAMGDLEMEVSGIKREVDYTYAIENSRGVFQALVYENDQKKIEGFMISVMHPALNMMGPCIARSQNIAIELIKKASKRFKGTSVLLSIPMDKRDMVKHLYSWKAINVETHLKEVWGEFNGFNGISLPSFLPETG